MRRAGLLLASSLTLLSGCGGQPAGPQAVVTLVTQDLLLQRGLEESLLDGGRAELGGGNLGADDERGLR